ncbi:putative heavy metal-associated domain, HMA [Medicago truncatula]|uniref:Heavy-metal-associated domain protein n=1 Tax=Medicago truncatula TaxID=3880 RepID=G7J3E0_MEDTR|nr:heavy metal-associated isoprenylated plant protein 7 [Medicago truncatula]AES73041.1 heavy-metal-associated domain protein [Medicago truncatula]RHN70110.1 putative heavy metal-associated domain, HMA [Medicago truncatula]
MGEEEQKTEEPKKEEETKPEERKDEAAATPPPPAEILLRVFMHCEGCARKVRRSLKDFPGVEEVITDCKSHMVVVKGEKAEPLKVLERVQKKSHRKVELLSPIPIAPEEEKIVEEDKAAPEEKKKKEPQIVTVVKIHMHCEACAQEIKKRILKMKGVEWVEANLKNSEVSVKGVYDSAMLVEYMYKRIGKHAVIVKEEKKVEEGEENKKKEGEGDTKPQEEEKETTKLEEEMKKNEHYFNPPINMYAYPPPPQMFSDENPNACCVM